MADPLDEKYLLAVTDSQRRIYAYVFSLVGNRDQALDIVQETNLVLWRRAAEFTPGTNFIAFAFKIAYFQVLAYRQRQRRDKLFFDDELLGQVARTLEDDSDEDIRQGALESCIRKLAPNHGDLLRLRYSEGTSIGDIATKFGRSVGSTTMLLHRIRVALLKCVENTLAAGGA